MNMFTLLTKNPTLIFETQNPLSQAETSYLFKNLPGIDNFSVDEEKKYRIEHNNFFLQHSFPQLKQ